MPGTLEPQALGGAVDFACMDLSFIHLDRVFPALLRVLKQGSAWVALVKPQFEAAPSEVPCGRDRGYADLRQRICRQVFAAAEEAGLGPQALMESPIHGRDGNIEFLLAGHRA